MTTSPTGNAASRKSISTSDRMLSRWAPTYLTSYSGVQLLHLRLRADGHRKDLFNPGQQPGSAHRFVRRFKRNPSPFAIGLILLVREREQSFLGEVLLLVNLQWTDYWLGTSVHDHSSILTSNLDKFERISKRESLFKGFLRKMPPTMNKPWVFFSEELRTGKLLPPPWMMNPRGRIQFSL